MNDEARSRLLFWGAIALLASFMPWASATATMDLRIMSFPIGQQVINGWAGSLTLLHVIVPNWFPVVAVLAAAYFTYRRGPAFALVVAGFYALLHLILIALVALGNGGDIGIGLVMAAVAFWAFVSIGSRLMAQPTSA